MIASCVPNSIVIYVKVLLQKLIIDVLVQFAFVRAKQPLGPILFLIKIIVSKFSACIFASYKHSLSPNDLLFQSKLRLEIFRFIKLGQ